DFSQVANSNAQNSSASTRVCRKISDWLEPSVISESVQTLTCDLCGIATVRKFSKPTPTATMERSEKITAGLRTTVTWRFESSYQRQCSKVRVHLQSNSVCVRVNDEAGEKTLMEGKFTHRISTADSLWCLEPGECVLVTSEFWWSAVLVGEAEIDVDKIRKERFVENDEEHAVLDRLHFDAQQKLQGKPQSHEIMKDNQFKENHKESALFNSILK
uniref:NudC domain-containing protein 3-like n=1 Tax=Gouania willdenowi TaxID=441366 RepID=A0A8C5G671_GOUWI